MTTALLAPLTPREQTARELTARERRALRRRVPVRPDWSCENCTAPNAGARKRCADCGTTRD